MSTATPARPTLDELRAQAHSSLTQPGMIDPVALWAMPHMQDYPAEWVTEIAPMDLYVCALMGDKDATLEIEFLLASAQQYGY